MQYYIPSSEKKEHIESLIDVLKTNCMQHLVSIEVLNNELVCYIKKDSITYFFEYLKDNSKCLFKQLTDITAIDYPERTDRFEIVYHLLSFIYNIRIRVKVLVQEYDVVESLSYLYMNADWLERELWDMFGIYVINHNDLRRILTDFGFDGHPLRKDFPLTGFSEVSYDEESDKVVYKPVELMQTFRDFSYKNPWMNDIHSDTFKVVNRNTNDAED